MKLIVRNSRSSNPALIMLRFVLWGLLSAMTLGSMLGAALYIYLSRDLPTIPPFDSIKFGAVSSVTAEQGMILGEVFTERRYLVPRDKIPDLLVNSVLSSEDERFFEHSGTDIRGIARAVLSNLRAGKVREGASTITQQVARALLLSQERSFKRKAREGIIARRLEAIYTKDQILLLYLNLIYLGEGSYGVEAASRLYFGKTAMELTLPEAATIAVLPQSPSTVTPLRAPDELKRRRDHVINRMKVNGQVTEDEAAAAMNSPISVVRQTDNLGDRVPYLTIEAISAIKQWTKKGHATSLLAGVGNIYAETTVDMGLQFQAQNAAWDAALEMSMRQGFVGPIATLKNDDYDRFLTANQDWVDKHRDYLQHETGNPLMALVTGVSKESAEISVSTGIKGIIPLEAMKWATKYTKFDEDNVTEKKGNLSLDGKLKDASEALSPGYVVLVTRLDDEKGYEGPDRFRLVQFPVVQSAMMAMDHRTGYVRAMAGGWDFDESQFNRNRAVRQTGSAVKPIYYSKAYDLGIPPSTILSGAPFREGDWNPAGSENVEDMTLFTGLTRSENRISLRAFRLVLDAAGAEGLNDWAARLGLPDAFKGFPSEALGIEQKPADMLRAYATFATSGLRVEPTILKLVTDDSGNVVLDKRSPRDPSVNIMEAIGLEITRPFDSKRRILTRDAAFIIAANLRNVTKEGTAKAAKKLDRPAFGKTGTLPYDVWFVGWTHELTAVSWIGQDTHNRFLGRNKNRSAVFAAGTALPMWIDFMATVPGGRAPVDDMEPTPPGIVFVEIDPTTGLLCRDEGIIIPHMEGTEPTELSPLPVNALPWVQAAFF